MYACDRHFSDEVKYLKRLSPTAVPNLNLPPTPSFQVECVKPNSNIKLGILDFEPKIVENPSGSGDLLLLASVAEDAQQQEIGVLENISMGDIILEKGCQKLKS